MRENTVVVVGAANFDLVYRVTDLPAEGETVSSLGTATHAGGKGLNQAIAAARAGAPTAFIGATGDDAAGDSLRRELAGAGVSGSTRIVDQPTGTAIITVDAAGSNTIVLSGGANDTIRDLRPDEERAISAASVLLLQLELDPSVALRAAVVAAAAGTTVVLNAAPMRQVPDGLGPLIDVLIVNEHEARALPATWALDPDAPVSVPVMIVTLGGEGVEVVIDGVRGERVNAIRSEVVDTTGAGDTFCGALVSQLAADRPLAEAVRYAVAAGALAVRREGAASSIPDAAEIRALLSADARP